MNIFCLDKDPVKAAQMMCDKHIVKMLLESAQLVCTAHRELDVSCNIMPNIDKMLYKSTHKNHPVLNGLESQHMERERNS